MTTLTRFEELEEKYNELADSGNYEKAAKMIAKALNLVLVVDGKELKDHWNDGQLRDVYNLTLVRGGENYSFEFGQSLQDSAHFELEYATLPENTYNEKWRKYNGGNFGAKLYFYEDDVKRDIEKILALYSKTFWKNTEREKYIKKNFKTVLIEGKKPGLYSVLASLTKYDPDTFDNFCSEYGYDKDSRSAYKTFLAVTEEYQNMETLFTSEELELLSIIC